MKTSYLILFFIFFLSACGNDDFTKQSVLNDLRVLAITADKPEVNNTTTIVLTPLVSYNIGEARSLSYSWEACPDPGIDFGAKRNCENTDTALKQQGSGTFDTAGLSSTQFTGNSTNINLSIPSAAFLLLSKLDSATQFNGIDYILFIKFTDPLNNKNINALKRITLSTKSNSELNTNPSFIDIQFNGQLLNTNPVSKGSIAISQASFPQRYPVQTKQNITNFTERMSISWYATKGEYQFNRTTREEANTYTPGDENSIFVAVYRDGRGGVATKIVAP